MGEITDALRRAWQERNARTERGPSDLPATPDLADPLSPIGASREAEVRAEAPEARIPAWREGDAAGRVLLAEQREVFAERFRHFALKVRRELERRATRTVLITSAVREDGKTTTASNLTLALASMAAGRRSALVELDLRKPGLSQVLGVAPPPVGLERVLRGEASLQAARLQADSSLDLFLVGRPVTHAHEILASPALGTALGELSRRYDTVVLDTPPVLVVPDVSLIISHVEACITVARIGATPRSAFRSMLDELPGEKIIGAFLNSVRSPRRFGRYDYYHGYDEDSAAG